MEFSILWLNLFHRFASRWEQSVNCLVKIFTLHIIYSSFSSRLYSNHGLVGFAGLFLASQVAHTLSLASTGFYSLINKMTSAAAEVRNRCLLSVHNKDLNSSLVQAVRLFFRVTFDPFWSKQHLLQLLSYLLKSTTPHIQTTIPS